ncbi:energy-coupling factor ABC transporter ATP-binding protein [Heyndrickxia oleronia]|uniref:energy-coupling factor ABC transporter ATP-binding protein n=1 Tax=Heyndrickxia oleronia TaxID=38875 RepID=UPI00203F3E5C|nr:ABC transporter ATP-binding protein [Heyndrickxia oleronia]MCM3238474.1 energy-coupling factor ABC transporter ATP-binding protein [Heyndrickxia oleronia]
MMRLIIKDLHFSYSLESPIFHGINLEISNQSTALIGQNGAGKTTLVKLLKGLLTPSSGEILINGINTKEQTAAKLAKTIGLVFQNPNDQIFKNRVMDEVMFGPLNIGQTVKGAKQNATEALEMVGLSEHAERNPYDLSLSQRKLVTIASVLAMRTDIIIFDEPTMGQDHDGKEKLKRIIRHLINEGKLVLCILHDMDFVAEVFERTIIFNQGKILLDGDTRTVFSNEEILNIAYLEQPYITQLGKQLGFTETFLNEDELIAQCKARYNNISIESLFHL